MSVAATGSEQSFPDLDAFCEAIAPHARRGRCLRELHGRLLACEAKAALPDRLFALEQLARWLFTGPRPEPLELVAVGTPAGDPIDQRFALLCVTLERLPPCRDRLASTVAAVLRETSALRLFSETGLPNDRGLLDETADRLSRRLLPTPPDYNDLTELLARMFRREEEVLWLERLAPASFERFLDLLGVVWGPLRETARDALELLVARTAALGLSEDIRLRSPPGPVRQSPYLQLAHAQLDELPAVVVTCRLYVDAVADGLEKYGVSVDVVYRLDVILRCLDRIESLASLLGASDPADALRPALALLASLLHARLRNRSLRDLGRANLRLLTRKVIEHAGQTGEHYITTTRSEYWRMMASAGGGGVLTVGTCAIKFLTKWGHYPLFIDGFLSAINYAASFVLMQLIGFTLATKQPSMTAAALAGTLRESRGDQGLDELVTIIVRICRSQLAAAIGNIGLVIPAAIGFDMVYQAMRGEPFLDHATAVKTVGSFHLLDSGTFFYAALTGVLLWCSSLAAGWLENWATYRRLPEALAEHRIQRLVGRRTTEWVAARFARHVSGFGGNVTLGFLLGMTPIMGTFFGLPLDVRHVTLSTGSLVLAILSGGLPVLASSELAWAVVGIVCIGLLNFGVSFALALAVALRAREVQASYKWRLARAVLRRFAQRPMPFFFPPRTGG